MNQKKLVTYSLKMFAVGAFLALLSFLLIDQQVSRYFDNENLLTFRKINRHLTDIGLSENFFILSIGLYLVFHWLLKQTGEHPRLQLKTHFIWLKKWSLSFFIALIFSGLILHILKFLLGRQRPHVSETYEADVFKFFQTDSYYQSMPSGHAQTLFCAAVMFVLLWPKATWLIYFFAFLLSLTRVVVHAHFFSDVIVGILVGHLSTLWCLWLLEKKFPKYFLLEKKL